MDLNSLFQSPDRYLQMFDGGDAVFVEMDRSAYHRSIFFDQRISPKSDRRERLSTLALCEHREAAGIAPRPVGYIFHVAHCGSTLLARALDVEAENLVCREPAALRQLAVRRAGAWADAPPEMWRRELLLVQTLLGRRYVDAGPVIIKGNVPINFIVPEVLESVPDPRAILLYFPLEAYLLAILRSPRHREWLGRVTAQVQPAIEALTGALDQSASAARRAAQLWLAQMRIYEAALAKHPGVVSVDADAFFDAPERILAAAFAHFGQPQPDAVVEAIVRSELFSTHSKNPDQPFDNATRRELRERLARRLGPELDDARAWVARAGAAAALTGTLPRPLVSAG